MATININELKMLSLMKELNSLTLSLIEQTDHLIEIIENQATEQAA